MPSRVKQPSPEAYVDPATFSIDQIFVPSPHVLRTEMLAWRGKQAEAFRNRQPKMSAVTVAILRRLEVAGRGQLQARDMRRGTKPLDTDFLHTWSAQTAGTLATVALTRHIVFGSDTPYFSLEEADIGIHFSAETPSNNRIFVRQQKLAECLRIEPPLPALCWYEFKDIFSEVEFPASDVETFGINYLNAHDHAFDFANYASFTPFLKQEVWRAGNQPSHD